MVIEFDKDGNAEWTFYRKAYRKARHRRQGNRALKNMLKLKQRLQHPDMPYNGGIIVIL